MNPRDKLRLKQKLARDGVVIEELKDWPAKATYYKPNGEAMRNLPADPYSMARYLGRGFTLAPPLGEVVPAKPRKHTRKFTQKQAQRKSKEGGKSE